MNTISPRAAKVSLHLEKSRKKRVNRERRKVTQSPPKLAKDQSVGEYYEEQANLSGLIDRAESLIDTEIMETVLEWKYRVEIGLIHTWVWSMGIESFKKHIVSILEDRWCTNISINESEVKRWLVPEKRSGITFSTKNMLKKKKKSAKK